MKIILDNSKEILVGSINENYDSFGKHLHAIYLVSVNDDTVFPTVGDINDNEFTAIKVINDNNIEIPLQYAYTTIENISAGYDDESNNYVITYNFK